MFNDISKPPPPLPSIQFTELQEGVGLLLPLTRRGHGPGLILLVPDTTEHLAICDGVPSPLIKWAEEGYTLIQIEQRALGKNVLVVLAVAAEALSQCDTCDPKNKIGLVCEFIPGLGPPTPLYIVLAAGSAHSRVCDGTFLQHTIRNYGTK